MLYSPHFVELGGSLPHSQQSTTCPYPSQIKLTNLLYYRGADKSLARSGRKQATFPALYGTWSFITTFTTVHHLSLPYPNQSILLPITILTGAACFLPGPAKDLSAPRHKTILKLNWTYGIPLWGVQLVIQTLKYYRDIKIKTSEQQ